ncbi:pilus assembly protein [Actinoallomurus sp. NBC_01490]|uniref:TadE family protein n=1 Tax=Actinoallomurus sp. NBC_01490 TaxID=2903557 RepID=UPI002E3109FC|nr:TadE family protein [Actinoallomurus sp. NBC_01490]
MRRRDTGSITLEIVIAFPVAMLGVLLTINAALWYHARNIALAAAQEGVRTGRAYHANPAQGATTAITFARTSGRGLLLGPSADTHGSTPTTVVIHVRGQAVSLVPGLHLNIDQVARGPVERFTTETGGR